MNGLISIYPRFFFLLPTVKAMLSSGRRRLRLASAETRRSMFCSSVKSKKKFHRLAFFDQTGLVELAVYSESRGGVP